MRNKSQDENHKRPEIGQPIKLNGIDYKVGKITTVKYTGIELTVDLVTDNGKEKIVTLETSTMGSFNDPNDLDYFERDDLEGWIRSEYE